MVSIGEQFLTACTDCKNVMYLKIQDFFNAIIAFLFFLEYHTDLGFNPIVMYFWVFFGFLHVN